MEILDHYCEDCDESISEEEFNENQGLCDDCFQSWYDNAQHEELDNEE